MKKKNNSPSPVWHPYTQMQTAMPPVHITHGKGTYLYDKNGKRYIDAVSSWWTNLHGHAHPHVSKAIYKQAQKLEQVIFAGFTHKPAEQLAKMLLDRIPFHQKIFYTDNGSTAVEAGIKMALQYWWNKGQPRNKIIAFKDAYHGDTFGSMSASARGVFTAPFHSLLFDVLFIDTPVPGCEKQTEIQLKDLLKKNKDVAAFIYEPLVLGSGGMLMYNAATLDKLSAICKKNGVLTIADEVFTGFGRTGKFLATDYCKNKPDIICLSKGITGGFMPFAATTCTQKIYDAFLSGDKAKMFFHGHSYTGNPLGCAAGIASLEVFKKEKPFKQIARIENQHKAFAKKMKKHPKVSTVRQTGTIIAIEINTGQETSYLNSVRDKAYQYFIERGVVLRPLGNIVYILPPYCISNKDLDKVYTVIEEFLNGLA
ncbi:MAG TPA: adenosylmethionine--8-amino-7-oxononanoate transaminase [Chitinophagales bacterium]|nr:adenosylmethionine--8-amino-7-oxononanoate transaminase [Chitinophagales bacterium]